jgi:hypothetical protein
MGLLPWVVAILTMPVWAGILRSVSGRGWLGLLAWGVLFGIASLL